MHSPVRKIKEGSNNGSFTVGDSTSTSYAGVIRDGAAGAGTTAFTKQGTGTLTLSNANTYSGTTTVNNGTLLATNTTGSATGTSTVSIGTTTANSGTLGGTGRIGGTTTIASGGTITGGTDGTVAGATGTVGTLNLSSTVTINGTYVADVTSTTSDLLAVGSTLTLGTGSTLTISGTLAPPDGNGNGTMSYVLANYTSLVGTFTNFSAPGGYTLRYTPTELDLVPVPEPATWAGGMLLLGYFGYAQRRRVAIWARAAKTA